jgi:hypothetical protein
MSLTIALAGVEVRPPCCPVECAADAMDQGASGNGTADVRALRSVRWLSLQ